MAHDNKMTKSCCHSMTAFVKLKVKRFEPFPSAVVVSRQFQMSSAPPPWMWKLQPGFMSQQNPMAGTFLFLQSLDFISNLKCPIWTLFPWGLWNSSRIAQCWVELNKKKDKKNKFKNETSDVKYHKHCIYTKLWN